MAEIIVRQDKTVPTSGTVNIPVDFASGYPECLVSSYNLITAVNPSVLVGGVTIAALGTPVDNQKITFYNETNYTLGAFSITIFGVTMPSSLATKNFKVESIYNGTTAAWVTSYYVPVNEDGWIEAGDLATDSVTTVKILDLNVTTGKLEAGGAGVGVTNAKMAEMATVTVKGNDGAGPAVPQDLTMTELRTILAQKLTLTGDVTTGPTTETAATGVTTSATTIANDAITTVKILDDNVTVAKVENNLTYEVINLLVSFEAAAGVVPSVGDFKIKMPYPGSVTEIYAYATKAIAATDNGTIIAKNNAGTTMTAGTITFTASDARGTAYTVSPSADNTFVVGDILTFTTAKATAGGYAQLSIKIVRS